MTCHKIGRPPISTSGLGSTRSPSCSRVPRPPHKITTVGLTERIIRVQAPSVGSAAMEATANPAIFKAYDIRGLYGSDIDALVAELIGRAFTRVIAEREGKPAAQLRLGLGRDMRLSAPELSRAYRQGMCAAGAHVLAAGPVGTEMLYYLVGSRALDGGIMC